MKSRLREFLYKIEMDRAVFFAVSSKIWGLTAGPISMLLITTYFTQEIQGYYYTFFSLLALQTFIELGLGTVIQQFSSHEWAQLSLDPFGKIIGNPDAHSRLSSIAKIGVKWFGIGGGILTLGLALGGFIFFSTSPEVNVGWKVPWFALSLLTGLTIILTPIWSLLEGCNQVGKIYTFRFMQVVISNIAGWTAIIIGAQLWTIVVISLTTAVCSFYFLGKNYFSFLKSLIFSDLVGPKVKWSIDLLPMQWRIAVSWISGYICFSLFTPVLFKYHGSVVAGQMGMTWSLVGVIGAIAGSWVAPRVPQFAMYASECKYKELDQLFWRVTKIVTLVAFIVAIIILTFVLSINWVDTPLTKKLALRVFSPMTVAIFLLAQIIIMVSIPFSSYMRAHKQEPIMLLSVIGAIMICMSTLVLGKYYSGLGVAIGYLITNIILIPFVFHIWHMRRKSWIAATLNVK